MTETQLKTKVLKYLKDNFPDAWVFKTSDQWRSGVPDLLITEQGRSYAIELKVGDNRATKLQAHELRKIQKAGGAVGICYSVAEATMVMEGRNLMDKWRIVGGGRKP